MIPPEHLRVILGQMRIREAMRAEWIRKFGHVRPQISTTFSGHKFVAAGRRLFRGNANEWGYVPDFLLSYVPSSFGKDWWDAEVAKPEASRHPLFQWRVGCLRHRQNAALREGNRIQVAPDGLTAAYMAFAFNLFAIEDNNGLDETLLQSLRHPEHFQGAWYEVFVEATCLRAGFAVEHEDERDPSTRHAEFTITHKETGEKFSVEAKSKHRPGIFGRPGSPEERPSMAFGTLINKAIAKNPKHPLVIFIDTNLSFHQANRMYGSETAEPATPTKYMSMLCEAIKKGHGDAFPFAMLTFTNLPHLHVAPHDPDPPKHVHAVMAEHPSASRRKALDDLYAGVPLYDNIPNEWPTL
jgi:hypothetical protein